MNGFAKHQMLNGDFYEGSFDNNRRHGEGTCKFADGRIYKGDWIKDVPLGKGILKTNIGIFEGIFDKSKIANGLV
jgi:hypothetical protein